MRFAYILGSRRKYRNKMDKMQYRDLRHQRRVTRHNTRVAQWNAMTGTQKLIVAVIVAAFIIICMAVNACSSAPSGTPYQVALCKAQVQAELLKAESDAFKGKKAPATTEPAACASLSSAQRHQIATQLLQET